jgi:hypothetical protein
MFGTKAWCWQLRILTPAAVTGLRDITAYAIWYIKVFDIHYYSKGSYYNLNISKENKEYSETESKRSRVRSGRDNLPPRHPRCAIYYLLSITSSTIEPVSAIEIGNVRFQMHMFGR